MPELPEVETTKNAILPFKGKTLQRVIVNNPSLRWPVDEKAINKDSIKIFQGFGEKQLMHSSVGDSFQFQRKGYYIKDKDSRGSMHVFNKTVSLRDNWKNRN